MPLRAAEPSTLSPSGGTHNPLALAGGGAFRTLAPTEHTRTNAAIVERFLPVRFTLREDERAGAWWIEAAGR